MDSNEQDKLARLRLLLKVSPKRIVDNTPKVKQVSSSSNLVVGVYKIPESDKPFSIFFTKPIGQVTERPKPVTAKEFTFAVRALLSKNPHYQYIQSCKVGLNPTTYWFKDTKAITVLRVKQHADFSEISFSVGKTLIYTESEIKRYIK